MGVQTVRKAARLQEWANQIRDRQQSGMSVEEWAEIQGYSSKTYYYRQKRVREELLDAAEPGLVPLLRERPVFVGFPSPKTAEPALAVTVHIGRCSVEIRNGADSRTVEQVLRLAAGI